MGWGSDTFAVYNPMTWPGRFFALLGVFLGVFLFALLIDFVHSRMQPTTFQRVALEWVTLTNLMDHERDAAAKFIQIVWRYHHWKKKAKEQHLPKSDRSKVTDPI
jgi:hypothetical protein